MQERFRGRKNNCIYEAAEKLSLLPGKSGGGALKYHLNLVLTKEGYSKSRWDLPVFFKEVEISYHSRKSFKTDYFQSASKGQEFVVKSNQSVLEWAKELIHCGSLNQ